MNNNYRKTIPLLEKFVRRRWKPIVLVVVTLTLLNGAFFPIRTVRGLVVTTHVNGLNALSIDSNRIAGHIPSSTADIFVYDVLTSTDVMFASPLAEAANPLLFGNRIVIATTTNVFDPSSIFYCDMPVAAVLTPCPSVGPGSWMLIASGLLPFGGVGGSFALWGFPVFSGDLVVWPVSMGLSYFHFSSGVVTTISLTIQPTQLSTDGVRIVFASSAGLYYLDTSSCIGPCTPPLINTGLSVSTTSGTAVNQHVIAFDEPISPQRIRYYDIRTGIPSPLGGGPIGLIGFGGLATSAIWENRIAFEVLESDLGFDCNSDGTISTTDYCLRYWNFRDPDVLLRPDAAPPLPSSNLSPVVINDKIIAFSSPKGDLQYVRVPMQGDVDLDGKVDIIDLATTAICYGQFLKNVVPPC